MAHSKKILISLITSLSPRVGAFFIGLFSALSGIWMAVPVVASVINGVSVSDPTSVVYTVLFSLMLIVGISSIISVFSENHLMRFELSKVHMFSWSFLFLYTVISGYSDIAVPLYFVVSVIAIFSYISEVHKKVGVYI